MGLLELRIELAQKGCASGVSFFVGKHESSLTLVIANIWQGAEIYQWADAFFEAGPASQHEG